MRPLIFSLTMLMQLQIFAQTDTAFLESQTKRMLFFNQMEQFQEAYNLIEVSNAGLDVFPDTAQLFDFYMASGEASYGLGLDSMAIEFFMKAEALFPNELRTRRLMAIAYYRLGHTEKAIENFREILVRDSLSAVERSWLAKIYVDRNEIDSALDVLRSRPELLRNHTKLMLSEARIYTKKRQYYYAVPIFETLVLRKPNDEDLLGEFIQVLYKSKNYNQLLEFAPQYFLKRPSAQLAFMLAISYEAQAQLETAQEWYELAVELSIDPMIDQYLNYAAWNAEKLSNPKKAIQHYNEALRYNPEDGTLHYFLARVYDEQGQRVLAEKHFELFLKSDARRDNPDYVRFAQERISMYKSVRFMTGAKDSL
jgi:tetratricopeptide (TPR) repeat protein